MNKTAMLIFLLLLSFTPGCEEKKCIYCNDTVSCQGINWLELGVNDEYYLVDKCDFEFVGGHEGGWGDTLEMVNKCDGKPKSSGTIVYIDLGIYLTWSWNELQSIRLSQNWTGQTDKGLKIGDTKEKYQSLYPSTQPASCKIQTNFNYNDKVKRITFYKP